MYNITPKVQMCRFALFGKLWNAGKYVNFKHKRQEADLILHVGFAGVQELMYTRGMFGQFSDAVDFWVGILAHHLLVCFKIGAMFGACKLLRN